ncbi:MAG TPA: CvpA family protein [Cyclobacteriaceae bacterium]|nr:CvpA family protein [Cyclobacteriaceae bacterium]
MSWPDIILALIILSGAISGYREGFLMTVISLAAIILGILGGFMLLGKAMLMLDSNFTIDQSVLPYIAFAVVFVLIVVLVSWIGRLLRDTVRHTFLGGIDQAVGAIVGMVKTAFMLSVAIWILDALKIDIADWFASSRLYAIIEDFAPLVAGWIGKLIPAFQSVFQV